LARKKRKKVGKKITGVQGKMTISNRETGQHTTIFPRFPTSLPFTKAHKMAIADLDWIEKCDDREARAETTGTRDQPILARVTEQG